MKSLRHFLCVGLWRRWRLLVACAFLLLSSIVIGFIGLPAGLRYAQLRQLRQYVNRDLKALPESEHDRVEWLIHNLVPEASMFSFARDKKAWTVTEQLTNLFSRQNRQQLTTQQFFARLFGYQSWYLWTVTDKQGEERLVLFQVEPLFAHPGSTSVRIFVLDSNGRIISRSGEFNVGNRMAIEDASLEWNSGYGFPCVKITSKWYFGGTYSLTQYCAILDDLTFGLVRLEEDKGQPIAPSSEIGPAVPLRSADEWEAALGSKNRAEVLRALLVLGSCRRRDDAEEIDSVCRARSRWNVRAAVEELTQSKDQWIKENAKLALQEIERR